MTYQITLNDQEYAALVAAAAKSGTDPEQLLREMIRRLPTPSQRKRPLTAQEIVEKQYREGKISHIPTRQQLTQEEREARERRERHYAGGKPASEMIIEDRGPY
jgi:translation elongation factor EF-4